MSQSRNKKKNMVILNETCRPLDSAVIKTAPLLKAPTNPLLER